MMMPWFTRLLAYILGSLFGIYLLRRILLPSSPSSSFRHRFKIEPHIAKHIQLYDKIYHREQSYNDNKVEPARKFQYLGPTYGSFISSCDLTVLFIDARIGDPSYSAAGPAWFALESLAAHAPKDDGTICVVLLTHYCAMQKQFQQRQPDQQQKQNQQFTLYAVQEAVRDWIYKHSLPLFLEWIHQGRVRVTFLDVDKYNMKEESCESFGSSSGDDDEITPAFLNIDFWTKEFVKDIDSDVVLVMHAHSVLCQELDLWRVQPFAYVGGLWPNDANDMKMHYPSLPKQGICQAMPDYWKSWLAPQRLWERTKENADWKPDELLREHFPNVCDQHDGQGPVGSGGFSIRQRSWMQTAISTCPHEAYSGMDLDGEALACRVLENDNVSEDVYFSTVLRGLRAPLPSAVEAALFSAETLLVEVSMDMYGLVKDSDYDKILQLSNVKRIEWQGKPLTLPVGFHKPWSYLPHNVLQEISKACPYLKYMKPHTSTTTLPKQ